MKHLLKTQNPHFNHVFHGIKTFELRFNDRDFQLGDILVLQEYENDCLTGREVTVCVSSMLTSETFPDALKLGWVIMSLQLVERGYLDL